MVQFKKVFSRWRGQRGGVPCENGGSRPVPAGSMGIYIGEERRRFVIPTRFLSFPLIASMLNMYEDEIGYTPSGGIILPCSVDFFRLVLRLLEKNEAKYKAFSVNKVLEISAGEGIDECGGLSCRADIAPDEFLSVSSPLLHHSSKG